MAVPTNPVDAATKGLDDLLGHWKTIRSGQADRDGLDERRSWRVHLDEGAYRLSRTRRFKTLNGQAHLVIEGCLKVLIVLHCDTPPPHLFTHNTKKLTAELARHAPQQAALTDDFRGDISHKDISSWHKRANYHDAERQFDQPVSRAHTAELLRIAEDYTLHTVGEYQRQTGDQANETIVLLVLEAVNDVAILLGADGTGLDPPGVPGDDPPHPEEIEQLKTEQFLAQQRRARRADSDGS